MNNNKLTNRLRQRRMAQELTQTELAARACIGLSTLNRIERWHFRVSEPTAAKLAKALGCEAADVFPYLRGKAIAR